MSAEDRANLHKPLRSRKSVQKLAAASDCTDSAIAKSVQPPIVEVKVQDFRAKMKAFLEGEEVILLGNSWHCRGIVLPVAGANRHRYEDTEARRARLTRLFVAALDRLHR
jgi:hypothetical protein